ncbi:MAG: SDR family NAD(P)-dependent oxidoreductase [Solirubrobacteraceae bacterium]
MNLAGRTVLLTGATGGLGHAIARRLRAAGAVLVLTGRRTDVLEPLAAETGARALALDLTDADAVQRLASECADVDILVFNAGLPGTGQLTSFSVEELDRALAVNLRAPMVLARELAEHMVARHSGHLVFMSSLAGKVGPPRGSVYAATKFGLRGFAQSLREDLRPSGVGVSAIFPGFVRDAGMFHDTGTKLPPGIGTVAPDAVADAVVRAIERNRGEIDVAPMSLRAGAIAAGLAPDLAASVSRRLGGPRVAEQHVAMQRDKR